MSECDIVLLQKTEISDQWEIKELCAIFSLITIDNYAESKAKFGVSVPGYFDGNFDEFSKKREKFYSQYSYTYNRDESRAILQSFVPPEAYQAWVDCVNGGVGGLTCAVKANDDNVATVNITWRPPPGLGGLSSRKIALGAGPAPIVSDQFTGIPPLEGTRSVLIRRLPGVDISGVASGSVKKADGSLASYSRAFIVPKQKKPPEPQHFETNAGMANDALLVLAAEPHERALTFRARYECLFADDGDPWFEMTFFIDDKQVFYRRAWTGFDNNVIVSEHKMLLPAHRSLKLYARVNNYRTLSKDLSIHLDAVANAPKLAAMG